MFQPHSVRGLLSRRSQTRVQQDSADLDNHKDPDLESAVEAKLIIKDIDHQIEDIRQWRTHQKAMLDERLASNKAVADVWKQSYLGSMEKQQRQEAIENKSLLASLQAKPEYQQEESEDWRGDTNIFQYITNSNKMVQERKHDVENEDVSIYAEQTMMNEIEGLTEGMFRNIERSNEGSSKTHLSREQLKKEFDQIDQELRQVEQLLKD